MIQTTLGAQLQFPQSGDVATPLHEEKLVAMRRAICALSNGMGMLGGLAAIATD